MPLARPRPPRCPSTPSPARTTPLRHDVFYLREIVAEINPLYPSGSQLTSTKHVTNIHGPRRRNRAKHLRSRPNQTRWSASRPRREQRSQRRETVHPPALAQPTTSRLHQIGQASPTLAKIPISKIGRKNPSAFFPPGSSKNTQLFDPRIGGVILLDAVHMLRDFSSLLSPPDRPPIGCVSLHIPENLSKSVNAPSK